MGANRDVLCVSTSICKTEDSIALLEASFALTGQLDNLSRKLDSEG